VGTEPRPIREEWPGGPEDRLNSWKEIATFFGRDIRTVQRWEKNEGLPVHRHLHDKAGSVYAHRKELDVWHQSRRAVVDADSADAQLPAEEKQGEDNNNESEPAGRCDALVLRKTASFFDALRVRIPSERRMWELAVCGSLACYPFMVWLAWWVRRESESQTGPENVWFAAFLAMATLRQCFRASVFFSVVMDPRNVAPQVPRWSTAARLVTVVYGVLIFIGGLQLGFVRFPLACPAGMCLGVAVVFVAVFIDPLNVRAAFPETTWRSRGEDQAGGSVVRWWSVAMLLLVLVVSAASWEWLQRGSRDSISRTIVITRFDNSAAEPRHDRFVVELAEEVVTELTRKERENLRVVAAPISSTFDPSDPVAAGKKLGADYVLCGSIRGDNAHIHIIAQLIRTKDRVQVMDETYEGDTRDVLSLQTKVAAALTTNIRAKLTETVARTD
jgi:TolB-like protein